MGQIVVIDDDDDIRFLVRRRLEKQGHTVTEAPDGPRGLALIASDEPDLVVLDWMMPGLTGIDVLERLRADGRPRPRVLMLTARTQESDVARALEAGADGFLVKPFTASDLLDAVAALLDAP